jgi:hypothetical protein
MERKKLRAALCKFLNDHVLLYICRLPSTDELEEEDEFVGGFALPSCRVYSDRSNRFQSPCFGTTSTSLTWG